MAGAFSNSILMTDSGGKDSNYSNNIIFFVLQFFCLRKLAAGGQRRLDLNFLPVRTYDVRVRDKGNPSRAF
jgi:hypothetical protein